MMLGKPTPTARLPLWLGAETTTLSKSAVRSTHRPALVVPAGNRAR